MIIVLLINDYFDYFWVKATFQFYICTFPEVPFQILTTCYSRATLRFLAPIVEVEAAVIE